MKKETGQSISSQSRISLYLNKSYDIEQMKILSECLHKDVPKDVIDIIKNTKYSVHQMQVSLEFYEKGVPVQTIKEVMDKGEKPITMRRLYEEVLEQLNKVKKQIPEESEYVKALISQMDEVVAKINHQNERYDALNKKLSEIETSKDDEEVRERLVKENQDKDVLINSQQNELNKATVVNMSTYTDNYVNPLEMDVWSLDPNDSKGMVREKGEFMLGLCEQCIGDSLNSRQKSIIDRCVRKLYIDIARSKEKYIPVMSDFYDILMAQPEDEAKDIALSLELFVNGSLNIFNHQTNVDVDNRFTVYGIRDLGTELSPITMLVMMESIQNRIVENGKRGKATWLYIDEFHVLLNSEYSAKYLQQLWKKVRKQGGLCTGITQNVIDLLQNYTATTMLANSEFVALLKQANTDSSKMAEVIGVSEAQLRFVTNTASGMGLIKCGSVVIPFDNQISKDTDLYKLYNTNIHEIIEMKKHANEKC